MKRQWWNAIRFAVLLLGLAGCSSHMRSMLTSGQATSGSMLTDATPVPSATPATPSVRVQATLEPTKVPAPTPSLMQTLVVSEQPLMSIAEWERRFLSVWDREHVQYFDPWSKANNSKLYYFLAYGIDGNTAMYEASGNRIYLDRALYYINNVVRDARVSANITTSQYKDSYLGWAAFDDKDNVHGEEVSLYESYLWRYVAKLLRVIRQDAQLYDNPTYRAQFDALLQFTEKNIFEKWYMRDRKEIYRSRTHMASHWAYIALELSLIIEDSDKKALSQMVLEKINTNLEPYYPSSLRDQIVPNPENASAYFWDSIWGSYDKPGQDTSHGNNVIAYIVEAHDQGVYWTDDDIVGLKNLLLEVLWNGSYTKPSFKGYFDGSDPTGGDFQSDGFIKLGRYDPNIQRIYQQYIEHQDVLTDYYGNGALNAKILGLPYASSKKWLIWVPTVESSALRMATSPEYRLSS